MDEKGIQLGIGGQVCALGNRDQKVVNHVKDGDYELVSIIKCVFGDDTVIQPSAVFKGAYWYLEWGWNNPINAGIKVAYHTCWKIGLIKN